MRPFGLIAFALLAGIAAWLAIANRVPVVFSFDAFRPGAPGTSIEIPLFAVLLLGALAGILVGAAYMRARQARLSRKLAEERARADRLQVLLADETLARSPPVKLPLPSRTSD